MTVQEPTCVILDRRERPVRPKFAFVSAMEGVAWGGSEELWSQTALRLRRQGAEVSVNVPQWPEKAAPIGMLEEAGCPVCLRRRGRLTRLARRAWPGLPQRWLDGVRDYLVVISQGGTFDGLDWIVACAERGMDYVIVSQAAAEVYWPPERILAEMRRGFESARVCYFVSRSNVDVTRRQLASPLPHARVARNPFNVPYGAAPAWPEDDGVLRLACVGRLDAVCKGQDLIFEVLRQERWRRRLVEVSLIGRGPQEGTYRDLVRLYGLENVRFVGFTSDIEGVWAKHQALLLPSRIEGLPLAIVEAMLCGRPCIVTDVAGNAEAVEDGVTGFVAPAATVALLDEAMERAWEARGAMREMGRRAAERIRTMVPADPVGDFAEELMGIATGRRVGTATAMVRGAAG